MPEQKTTSKYKVLCWGACLPDHPCGINYISTVTGVEVRAETGEVVEDIDPASVKANRFVERGILEVVRGG